MRENHVLSEAAQKAMRDGLEKYDAIAIRKVNGRLKIFGLKNPKLLYKEIVDNETIN